MNKLMLFVINSCLKSNKDVIKEEGLNGEGENPAPSSLSSFFISRHYSDYNKVVI